MKDITRFLKEEKEMAWGNTPEEVEQFLDNIRKALDGKFPFVYVKSFDKQYRSLFVDVAFNPRGNWTNNIWHNAYYFSFSLYNPTGKVELLSSGALEMTDEMKEKFPYNALIGLTNVCGKFRAFTAKNDKDGKKTIKKLLDYLEKAYAAYKDYLKILEAEGKVEVKGTEVYRIYNKK